MRTHKKTLRELLFNRAFYTVEADEITGERKETRYATGRDYLADFEIEKLVDELSKLE